MNKFMELAINEARKGIKNILNKKGY